jgi:hypothetical protein
VKFTDATGVKLDGYGKFTLLRLCDWWNFLNANVNVYTTV